VSGTDSQPRATEGTIGGDVIRGRVAAAPQGEVIVFLIGMRINRWRSVRTWWRVAAAMPRMVRELQADPQSGFLSAHSWFGNPTIMVQYWRSFDDLERYAKDASREHRPAWAAFNRAVAGDGAVGIWHEMYRVRPGDMEAVYNNMPRFGLARATRSVPATGPMETADGRVAHLARG
jgi:hypothetical protein